LVEQTVFYNVVAFSGRKNAHPCLGQSSSSLGNFRSQCGTV
jgi:hypothetical protein